MKPSIESEAVQFPHTNIQFQFLNDTALEVKTTRPLLRDGFEKAAYRMTSPSYVIGKRCLDVVLSSIMLILLMPILLVIALAVRISSPGPIFYCEQRVGQLGRKFTIFKFRSMYTKQYLRDVLLHEECHVTLLEKRMHQKGTRDPRVTRVGDLLRRLSLDELPQLYNVFIGDMSLVGPRPVVEAEVERYGPLAAYYMLAVPGISGLWQVSGRNDVSYERRIELDAEYCSNWSLMTDLRILLRTIPCVFRRTGAY